MLQFEDQAFPVTPFRAGNPFEAVGDWAVAQLTQVFDNFPELITLRCNLTGFPVAALLEEEVEQLIRTTLHSTGWVEYQRANPIGGWDESTSLDCLYAVLEQIQTTVVLRSHKATSLTMSKNRLAIVGASWDRQLSILLNVLIFDAAELRQDTKSQITSLDDRITRQLRLNELADAIGAAGEESLSDLFSAMIELDAKYSIREMAFTQAERNKIAKLAQESIPDFDAFHKLALNMIAYRERTDQVIEDGVRWTRDVYQSIAFSAVDRVKFSNVFKAQPKPNKPKTNKDGTKAESAKKKTGPRLKDIAELTPNARRRREDSIRADRAADAFASVMADFAAALKGKN